MFRKIFMATCATAAIAFAAPAATAQGHGGGGGGGANVNANVNAGANVGSERMGGPSQTGIDARINSQGSVNASPRAIERASPNSALNTNGTATPTTRATNSQGLQNASPNAIGRANANSALGRGAVPSTALPGLTTGLTVQTSSGTTLGTVSQVVTGTDGSIRLIVVTSPSGATYRLSPATVSISGGVVTTTSG